MLKVFDELKPFFDDVYQEISVREYARAMKISPPTASKLLRGFAEGGLLIAQNRGIYSYYRAHREEYVFRTLSRVYWYMVLRPLVEKMREQAAFGKIVLFGSLANAENTTDSDVDLFIQAEQRKMNVEALRRALGRDIQLHFSSVLKNEHLKKNIEKGIVL